jgi:hypothetical protein
VRFWWGNLNEIEFCGGLGVGLSVVLKLILKERGGRAWIGLIWRAVINTLMNFSFP